MRAASGRKDPEEHIAVDPHEQRAEMARRLPRAVQPFLTWLTALPAPGDGYRTRAPKHHIAEASALLAAGTALSAAAVTHGGCLLAVLPFGMIATASGMGVLQAVVYHHCSHGTVLATRRANRSMGRFISLLLLIKDFDVYRKEHIAHHNPKRLLTEDDEFLNYLSRFIRMAPGMSRHELWCRAFKSFFSPTFHMRLLTARLRGCLVTCDVVDRATRMTFWGSALVCSYWIGAMMPMLVAWFVPATILFQIATTLRVLAEHRFAPSDVMARRDRGFIARSTAGVFPGAAVPRAATGKMSAVASWAIWWSKMLTVHLFSRVFVLVGDAPAHDYHHRHPGSRDWPSYIHARSRDRALGCPGFPVNYIGTLGLFRAINENLASLATARPSMAADDMAMARRSRETAVSLAAPRHHSSDRGTRLALEDVGPGRS